MALLDLNSFPTILNIELRLVPSPYQIDVLLTNTGDFKELLN